MYCTKCSAENSNNVQFCKKCGYKFPEKEVFFESVKEKIITESKKVSKNLKPVISKTNSATRSFYQKTILPTYQQKIKSNAKMFLLGF